MYSQTGHKWQYNTAPAHCISITKATNTYSEYVILIAFPLQQWLYERVSVLRYTYIACLVLFSSYLLCPPRRNFLNFVLSVIVDAFLVISLQALAQLAHLVVNSTISPSVAIKCGEFFD